MERLSVCENLWPLSTCPGCIPGWCPSSIIRSYVEGCASFSFFSTLLNCYIEKSIDIFSSICSSSSALFTCTYNPHRCFTELQSLTPNQATEKLPFNRRKPWAGPRSGRFALFTLECASEDSFIVWCLLFLRKLQRECSVLTEISTHSFFGMIRMWPVPRGDVATGRCLCFIMEEAKLNQRGHRNLTPPPCYAGPPPAPCNVLPSSRWSCLMWNLQLWQRWWGRQWCCWAGSPRKFWKSVRNAVWFIQSSRKTNWPLTGNKR